MLPTTQPPTDDNAKTRRTFCAKLKTMGIVQCILGCCRQSAKAESKGYKQVRTSDVPMEEVHDREEPHEVEDWGHDNQWESNSAAAGSSSTAATAGKVSVAVVVDRAGERPAARPSSALPSQPKPTSPKPVALPSDAAQLQPSVVPPRANGAAPSVPSLPMPPLNAQQPDSVLAAAGAAISPQAAGGMQSAAAAQGRQQQPLQPRVPRDVPAVDGASAAAAAKPSAEPAKPEADYFSELGMSNISYTAAPSAARKQPAPTPVAQAPVPQASTRFTADSLLAEDEVAGAGSGWGAGGDLDLDLDGVGEDPATKKGSKPKKPAKKAGDKKKKGLVQVLDESESGDLNV